MISRSSVVLLSLLISSLPVREKDNSRQCIHDFASNVAVNNVSFLPDATAITQIVKHA